MVRCNNMNFQKLFLILVALLLPFGVLAQTITPSPAPPSGLLKLNYLMLTAAIAARFNNPRVNPVMASPPSISSSASHNAALTNQTVPLAAVSGIEAGGSAFNFYGGAITSDGAGGYKFPSTTVSSSLVQYVWRLETIADSAKMEFEVNCISGTCGLNFIVNGQYVSYTVTQPGISGVAYVTLDFTSAGGRATRDISMEVQNADMIKMSIGATETISKPQGTVRRIAIVGDSLTASGGMLFNFMGYAQILPDMLGIRDVWNLGVGGTGIIATGGQLACPARISDLVAANPDVIVLACGRNDTGSTTGAVTAAELAWLQAVRADFPTTPIIVFATWGNTALATEQATETAMQAAVTQFADPANLTWFIPMANATAGPAFTGTGYQGATTGSGNSDVYIYTDGVHPSGQNYGPSPESGAGHWFLANWLANAIMQQVLIP
jgi:lysophospholipase L1-like esterase